MESASPVVKSVVTDDRYSVDNGTSPDAELSEARLHMIGGVSVICVYLLRCDEPESSRIILTSFLHMGGPLERG